MRHRFRVKPDARADPEGGNSTRLCEFVNDDLRNCQDGGELCGSQSAPNPLDPVGQA